MRALAGMIQFCSSFFGTFRADGSERRAIRTPGYQLPPANLFREPPDSVLLFFFLFFFLSLSFYRVLINDARCSPREARRLGNRRSSQAYDDFSSCPPSLSIFIEYQPRISYTFLFVPMFLCRFFLLGIRNRVKSAKKTFGYSDQT